MSRSEDEAARGDRGAAGAHAWNRRAGGIRRRIRKHGPTAALATLLVGLLSAGVVMLGYSLQGLAGRIEDTHLRIDDTHRRIGDTHIRISDANARITRLEAHIDEKFQEQETKFDAKLGDLEDKINLRFANVDARFARVDEKFADVDRRFDEVDARFDKVDARFDRFEERFDEMSSQLTAIITVLSQRDGVELAVEDTSSAPGDAQPPSDDVEAALEP